MTAVLTDDQAERIAHCRQVYDDARIDATDIASLIELPTSEGATRRAARMMARGFPLADIEAGLTRWHELYGGAR